MKKTLDVRTLDCPKPVIETKKAIAEKDITQLEVLIGNPTARENLKRFAETTGFDYEITDNGDGTYTLVIDKTGDISPDAKSFEPVCDVQTSIERKGKTYLILSDKLGKGEDELGKILIKGFLYTLTQAEPYPEKILLLNSAVRLSTENAETIEHLKSLTELGTQIFSCGTCLNFYNLTEELKVGLIGNMYDVVDSLNSNIEVVTIG